MGVKNGRYFFKPEMVHVDDFYIDPRATYSEEEARFIGRKGMRESI